MNDDRVEGSAKQVGGKIKEATGKALGDEKLKREGQTDRIKGKIQNTIGSVKDELQDDDKDKRGE
jgi:uncharacterized protein YjbJ (UPF0337 family)